MTVAELIEALKQMPQDAQVYSHLPYSGEFAKIVSPESVYTDADKEVDVIDWVFPEEHADDDMNLDDYVQIVVL